MSVEFTRMPRDTDLACERFVVDDGVISVSWPRKIAESNRADIEDWLPILCRKVLRAIGSDVENRPEEDVS